MFFLCNGIYARSWNGCTALVTSAKHYCNQTLLIQQSDGLLHNNLLMPEKKNLIMYNSIALHKKYNLIKGNTIVTSKNTIVIHKTQLQIPKKNLKFNHTLIYMMVFLSSLQPSAMDGIIHIPVHNCKLSCNSLGFLSVKFHNYL